MNRKYPEVTGWWCYCLIFPDGMFYIGCSGKKYCYERWQPQHYKHTTVLQYIEKYGWDDIRKIVLKDGLTEEQAKILEDLLIQEARKGGWCINEQRSGLITLNRKEYNKQYAKFHKNEIKEYHKQYYKDNIEYFQKHQKEYYKNNKNKLQEQYINYRKIHNEERRELFKKWRSTPDGKIYTRVTNYNRNHPECKLITPMEAKEMYLLTGYIPDFIKNDDLK